MDTFSGCSPFANVCCVFCFCLFVCCFGFVVVVCFAFCACLFWLGFVCCVVVLLCSCSSLFRFTKRTRTHNKLQTTKQTKTNNNNQTTVGLNGSAQKLQPHEAKAIACDPVLQTRIIRSYEVSFRVLICVLLFVSLFGFAFVVFWLCCCAFDLGCGCFVWFGCVWLARCCLFECSCSCWCV